jgi:hypothetical protein
MNLTLPTIAAQPTAAPAASNSTAQAKRDRLARARALVIEHFGVTVLVSPERELHALSPRSH